MAVDDISALLNNKALINAITSDSRFDDGRTLGWMDLWNKAVNHAKKEMDKWLKDVEKHNSKVGAKELSISLKAKKFEAMAVPKLVLSKCVANSKCLQVIKVDIILDDLLQFLSSSIAYSRAKRSFGAEVIDVIVSIISSQTLARKLRIGPSNCTNQWKSLMDQVMDILMGRVTIDDLTLFKSLEFAYRVILHGSQYSSFWPKLRQNFQVFFTLFEQTNFKQEPTETRIEVVKLINVVQEILKREARFLLCSFGEKIAPDILAVYEVNKTEEFIIEFFQLNVQLHHPSGARNKDQGALIIDERSWCKQTLPHIFERIVVHTIKKKQIYNRNTRGYRHDIDPNLLKLAVSVALQMYVNVDTDHEMEDPQSSQPPSKKIRLDQCSFQTGIIGRIKFDSTKEKEEVMIPWLQILHELIWHLNVEELEQAEVKILDLLKQSRSALVKDHLLR